MKTIEMVKGKRVKFIKYKKGNLYYSIIGLNFEFPVPINDIGDAEFLDEDKASYFMRYINKHKKTIEEGKL